MNSRRFLLICGMLLALPRLARILYPALWVEDTFYMYAGNLVNQGILPYRDFVHTQYPGVEFLLAALYRLLGPSTATAEILTQAFAWAGSFLVLLLGVRLKNRRTGLIAAILLSTHSLLFRYHLCQREVFAMVPAIGILWLAFQGPLTGKKAVLFSLLAGIGISFKLTFLLPCFAAFLYLVWWGRYRDALGVALCSAAALIAVTSLLWLAFREEFLWQAILYHFAKGANVHGMHQRLAVPVLSLDWALALGLPAAVFLSLEDPDPRRVLPLAWLVPEGILFTLFSQDLWPHNYISVLPGLCLLAGLWLDRVFRGDFWEGDDRWIYHRALMCLTPVVLLFTVIPLKNHQWERGSIHGFGFLGREQSEEIARIIQDHARPDQRILAPEHLALDAGRRLFLDDRMEAAGPVRRLQGLAAEQGLIQACRIMGKEDFWMQTEGAQIYWKSEAVDQILEGKLPVVIPFLYARFKEELFQEAGYQALDFTWYRVWLAPSFESSGTDHLQ